MARKMFEKAGLIPGLQSVSKPLTDATAPTDSARPKTAPGTMMGFLTAQSAAVQEAEALKERVRALEADSPLRNMDPASVKPSKWANRHEASFRTAEFAELKAEIAAAGGNVQPIKVRPIKVLNGSTLEEAPGFELIYGHRRHRACLELGLPVTATVEEATDVSLFAQMERENRGRKNLSAWEQGTMYRRALDDGLYPSLRRLAEDLGVDVSLVSKSVSLARLPEAVVAAFPSPLEIQFRWAAPLAEAMQKDPEGTLAKAQAIATEGGSHRAADVFARLTASNVKPTGTAKTSPLKILKAGKSVATLSRDGKGRAVVQFQPGALSETREKSLVKLIEDFLKT